MRIVSNYKDFYDHVVSQPDNKKVYVRDTKEVVYKEEDHKRNPEKTILSPISYDKISERGSSVNFETVDYKSTGQGYMSVLAYCDKLHHYFQYGDQIFWNYEDIPEDILKKITPKKSRWSNIKDYEKWSWGRSPLRDMHHFKKISWILDRHTKEPIKTNLNKLFNSPLVFMHYPNYLKITVNPKLTDIGFNKVIPPTEAYQDIYNWIPYNEPEVPSSPNDMSRYEAKGFDKKTSFRPNMK
jgi:hypothetical protein